MKTVIAIFLLLFYLNGFTNNITVCTYNVNYSFINENLTTIIDSIDSDVICLQETNLKWEKIIRRDLINKYPYTHFKHCCTAGGLAILSKYPIINIESLQNAIGWFPALAVTIEKEQQKIQFLNIHLKPGLTKKGRIGWNAYFKSEEAHIEEISNFIKGLNPDIPNIILGDFNESDKGKSLAWLMKTKSFKNALPNFDKKSKTWRFGLLRGRYDHITSNKLLQCTNAKVYKLGKSDHLPLSAEFTILSH